MAKPHAPGCKPGRRAGIWDQLHQLLLTMLASRESTASGDGDHRHDAGARLRRRRRDRSQPRRSPQKRDEIHAAGRSRRRAAGDSCGAGQSQRPLGDSADGRLVSRRGRQAGTSAHASRRAVRRRGLRLRTRREAFCAGWESSRTFGIASDEHGSHLGRVRWVVERTISWIKGLRRMRVRYDRSGTSIDAWTSIAAAVVCLHILMEVVT